MKGAGGPRPADHPRPCRGACPKCRNSRHIFAHHRLLRQRAGEESQEGVAAQVLDALVGMAAAGLAGRILVGVLRHDVRCPAGFGRRPDGDIPGIGQVIPRMGCGGFGSTTANVAVRYSIIALDDALSVL